MSLKNLRARKLGFEPMEPRLCLSLAVPAFSSFPGAKHTVYLDFDGHVTTGTSWNNYWNTSQINSPPYDIDGNTSSFSTAELNNIEEAWKRIAEDFIPFEVNVTTVDPGIDALRKTSSNDEHWGVRMVITRDTQGCGCGGIAYINSFNWNSDTPVFVYTTSAKNIAEAGSHEVGHSLGLSHDGLPGSSYYSGHGSGELGWASIMGVGYSRNVTQWDNGVYYNSNNGGANANYNRGPDDLQIITTFNGFSYRVDDHGDTAASATPLAVNGTSVSAEGIIERNTDVDVFRFTTGAGPVSLNIAPFTPGPNLKVKADLYDAAGNLVATSNPSNSLSASLSLQLAAGDYFLHIEGAGVGNPSANPPSGFTKYASLGRYTITGTIVEPRFPRIVINSVSAREARGNVTLRAELLDPPGHNVTVSYRTIPGTAVSGEDYVHKTGSVTFTPTATSRNITVSIVDDTISEPHENFFVELFNATGSIPIEVPLGEITILNDDGAIAINDVAQLEGNPADGKSVPMYFTVSLEHPSMLRTSVSYFTVDGTATTANRDYAARSGTVHIPPGATSGTFFINIGTDLRAEEDEEFYIQLHSPVNGYITRDVGTGTILDDDAPGTVPPGNHLPPGGVPPLLWRDSGGMWLIGMRPPHKAPAPPTEDGGEDHEYHDDHCDDHDHESHGHDDLLLDQSATLSDAHSSEIGLAEIESDSAAAITGGPAAQSSVSLARTDTAASERWPLVDRLLAAWDESEPLDAGLNAKQLSRLGLTGSWVSELTSGDSTEPDEMLPPETTSSGRELFLDGSEVLFGVKRSIFANRVV